MNDVPVQVQDSITILGNVVLVSGQAGSQAVVVVQPKFGTAFTTQASDNNSPATGGLATSYSGQSYGVIGAETSTPATVLAVLSGTGSIALLQCKLRSGLIVMVASGSCACQNQGGIMQGSI